MTTNDIEHQVATAFAGNMARHRMMVRLDQGLYRHLVFEQPEHSWNDRFELITAPGSLTITGDRGAHTFRRTNDMLAFFRGSASSYCHGINPMYWAEKLADGGRSVQVYSEHALNRHLKELLNDLAQDYRRELAEWRAEVTAFGETEANPKPEMPKVLRRTRELISDYRLDGQLSFQEGARELLRELESIDAVCDTWEWGLTDWDYHFLHNLCAIAWGIRQYDHAVRTGLHIVRTGPVAWDEPLPTVAPAAPKPRTPATATATVAGGAR